MKFKIDLHIEPQAYFKEHVPVSLWGSCFSAYQGQQFERLAFPTQSNPFGIIYNPVSIARLLSRVVKGEQYTEADFIQQGKDFFSLEHHGSLRRSTIDQAIQASNELITGSRAHLAQTQASVITLGTSLVYTWKQSGEVVANCHKLPVSDFDHRFLSLKEIEQSLIEIQTLLRTLNPGMKIIWTISPIRHIRSGIQESNLSKSLLRTALHHHLSESKNESYFPAFEILIDELRDYRFTGSDLTHPTEDAQAYIWKRFMETYFDTNLHARIKDIESYRSMEAHRAIKDPELHQHNLELKKQNLLSKYPELQL